MKVEVRNNNVDKALRILKKKLQQDGFFNELREREYYTSKGEKTCQSSCNTQIEKRKKETTRRAWILNEQK